MSDSVEKKTNNKAKDKQLETYLDGYIRKEMLASYIDFLKGEPRNFQDGTPVQVSIQLHKITKITMVYNANIKLSSTKIDEFVNKKLFGRETPDKEDAMLYKYYKVVEKTAKRVYSKHQMALKAIEESCFEKTLPEGACLAMKLLYLYGAEIPDERNRYMGIGINKSSKRLASLLSLCLIPSDSSEYKSKMYRYGAKKALKRKMDSDTDR